MNNHACMHYSGYVICTVSREINGNDHRLFEQLTITDNHSHDGNQGWVNLFEFCFVHDNK